MKNKISLIVVALLLIFSPSGSFAAKKSKKPKKPSGVIVSSADIFTANVKYLPPGSKSKKKKSITVKCFGKLAGKSGDKANGYTFTSFKQEQKILDYLLKYDKKYKQAKNRKKAIAQRALAKVLEKASKGKCVEPEFLGLAKYNGPWGETQVRRLLTVFANGGEEAWVQPYINAGMENAVSDLLTFKPDPKVEQLNYEITCDPNPDDNERNCYPDLPGSDVNDYYLDGYISFLNLRSIITKNPVFDSLAQFVLDQAAPANPRVLNGCNRYYFKDYISNVVDRFAYTGDYKEYILNTIVSPMVHGKWLSGDSNHPGIAGMPGNEDFSRELLELIGLGPNGKDGYPNYNDQDILESSRILAGLDETSDNGFCSVGFHPDLGSPGLHTVFAGTSYQITVNGASPSNLGSAFPGLDYGHALVEVRKSHIAWNLARQLWPRFINSKGTPASIQKLADLIEANDLKLLPVVKIIMQSDAFYADESAGTIVKSPFTFFVTYARQMGIPFDDYNAIRGYLDSIGMLMGRPPTVFGFSYQLRQLAADVYQEFRFNSIFYYTMWQNFGNIKEEYGWTPYSGIIAGIPRSGDPAVDVVDHLLRRLNLAGNVTPDQRAQYIQFINYYIGGCYSNNDPECFMLEGNNRKLYRDAPDLGDEEDDFYRGRLLAVMLATSDAFGVM